jgi:hypothetical protein
MLVKTNANAKGVVGLGARNTGRSLKSRNVFLKQEQKSSAHLESGLVFSFTN